MNLIVAEGKEQPDEKVLAIKNEIIDKIRLVSVYKGIPVPSILFDSTGTKKIVVPQCVVYMVFIEDKSRIHLTASDEGAESMTPYSPQ